MSEPSIPPKVRLAALLALTESPGWAEVVREMKQRHAAAVRGALDLDKKRRKRDGCAGAAVEIEQLLNHVPLLIDTLSKQVEKEKKAVLQKLPT